MNVIAKMQVRAVEDYGMSRKISFGAVHDTAINKGHDSAENRSFSKATPNGEAWMTVDNQAVWPAFKPATGHTLEDYIGAQHYVVFVPCAEHSLEDVQRALASL